MHATSDTASCPLSWRLFLPASWDGPEAQARRRACRIPATAFNRPKWQLALDILDEFSSANGPLSGARMPATARTPTSTTSLDDRRLAWVY
ncbi:transposase [Streptomyces sp. NPDC056254]|uniref:transposase n=1 Tax=Streptomyces sp. NPDC056254 TaxID=3345763 RepID=UPI0035DD81F5